MAARKPITIVEIDLPYCTRAYGVSPCTAVLGTTGVKKCFNSRKTCQDLANYSAGVKTVSYCYNQDGIPDIPGIYPALESVSSRPGEINLSGIDPNMKPLGVRHKVTVTLRDFGDSDTWLDKYQSERRSGAALSSGIGYNPFDRGTHFGRLVARFPYYLGLALRVRRGEVGQAPADMPTENYVITNIAGPNAAGAVQIEAKDVFDLADDNKATCPRISNGKLSADIDNEETTTTLKPTGIGSEYAASGLVRIGREICIFTRSGDVLTLVRGTEKTTAEAHREDDIVQECAVFEKQPLYQAAATLCTTYAGIDAGFVPSADWSDEQDDWGAGMFVNRTIIPAPVGVSQLMGELCIFGAMFYWGPVAQEIKYKINSPLAAGETLYQITDDNALIMGSQEIDRAEDKRISAIWIANGIRDWTESADDPKNYNHVTVVGLENNPYGQDNIKRFALRWLGVEGNDAICAVIGERLLSRYGETPKVITGQLDVKDRDGVQLASRIEVTTYLLQDDDGASGPEPMQVSRVEFADNRLKFEAETYRLEGRFGYYLDEGIEEQDYDLATAQEKAEGAYYFDENETDFGDGTGPYVYF